MRTSSRNLSMAAEGILTLTHDGPSTGASASPHGRCPPYFFLHIQDLKGSKTLGWQEGDG